MGNCSFTNFAELRVEAGVEMARAWSSEDP